MIGVSEGERELIGVKEIALLGASFTLVFSFTSPECG
jgi:hypothetical protein